jgi:branched-chain amino acid transport system substrate-binding protein
MPKSWLRILAMVAVLALGLAACPADDPAPVDDTETPDDTTPPDTEPTDEALQIGYVLPETGPLAFLAPAQISGVQMAIQEANDAGGVLGHQVELLSGDEAGDAAVASESADRLLAEGVHAIVGAAASGMSFAIIDQVTGAGVVQCSASNTAADFTDYDDNGYYFRTAPSDALQAPMLAEVVLEDGHVDIAMIARADDYGVGLLEATRDALEEAGANIVYFETYDPDQTTFDAEASEISAAGPDAVVTVPFEEGVQILQALIEQGIDPGVVYGADGIRGEDINERVDPDNPNVIDGFKGTAPDPSADPEFLNRLRDFDPDVEVTIFSPQAYDCAMWIMLAAEAAGSVDSTAIRDNMLAVTEGDNECATFEECRDLLADGQSISWQFASGVLGVSDVGEPVNASYEIWEWQGGELTTVEVRDIVVED